jgi:hypothetical protein
MMMKRLMRNDLILRHDLLTHGEKMKMKHRERTGNFPPPVKEDRPVQEALLRKENHGRANPPKVT